jgi:hypothetical protein
VNSFPPTLDDVHHQSSMDHSPSVSHRPQDEKSSNRVEVRGKGVNKKKSETKQKIQCKYEEYAKIIHPCSTICSPIDQVIRINQTLRTRRVIKTTRKINKEKEKPECVQVPGRRAPHQIHTRTENINIIIIRLTVKQMATADR